MGVRLAHSPAGVFRQTFWAWAGKVSEGDDYPNPKRQKGHPPAHCSPFSAHSFRRYGGMGKIFGRQWTAIDRERTVLDNRKGMIRSERGGRDWEIGRLGQSGNWEFGKMSPPLGRPDVVSFRNAPGHYRTEGKRKVCQTKTCPFLAHRGHPRLARGNPVHFRPKTFPASGPKRRMRDDQIASD